MGGSAQGGVGVGKVYHKEGPREAVIVLGDSRESDLLAGVRHSGGGDVEGRPSVFSHRKEVGHGIGSADRYVGWDDVVGATLNGAKRMSKPVAPSGEAAHPIRGAGNVKGIRVGGLELHANNGALWHREVTLICLLPMSTTRVGRTLNIDGEALKPRNRQCGNPLPAAQNT